MGIRFFNHEKHEKHGKGYEMYLCESGRRKIEELLTTKSTKEENAKFMYKMGEGRRKNRRRYNHWSLRKKDIMFETVLGLKYTQLSDKIT